MFRLIVFILAFSLPGFSQDNNVLESKRSLTPPCNYALHKHNPTSPYLVLFNQDTINQIQDTGNKIKYGRWVFFRKNGYVKYEGYYEWGMKQGYWKYYTKLNQLKKIVKFKNDQVLEIHDLKRNYHKFFEYNKASENWDLGESRFLGRGNCQISE